MGKDIQWIQLKWLKFVQDKNLVGFKYNVDAEDFDYMNVKSNNIVDVYLNNNVNNKNVLCSIKNKFFYI